MTYSSSSKLEAFEKLKEIFNWIYKSIYCIYHFSWWLTKVIHLAVLEASSSRHYYSGITLYSLLCRIGHNHSWGWCVLDDDDNFLFNSFSPACHYCAHARTYTSDRLMRYHQLEKSILGLYTFLFSNPKVRMSLDSRPPKCASQALAAN